eukprot:756237-Hanusia_phi.AAC.6
MKRAGEQEGKREEECEDGMNGGLNGSRSVRDFCCKRSLKRELGAEVQEREPAHSVDARTRWRWSVFGWEFPMTGVNKSKKHRRLRNRIAALWL